MKTVYLITAGRMRHFDVRSAQLFPQDEPKVFSHELKLVNSCIERETSEDRNLFSWGRFQIEDNTFAERA